MATLSCSVKQVQQKSARLTVIFSASEILAEVKQRIEERKTEKNNAFRLAHSTEGTPPRDEPMYDIGPHSNLVALSDVHVQNFDFGEFIPLVEETYEKMRGIDPRLGQSQEITGKNLYIRHKTRACTPQETRISIIQVDIQHANPSNQHQAGDADSSQVSQQSSSTEDSVLDFNNF
ncbi:unnamed protein product [Diatraea saccharalis]|uniref:Uncharacterized protein n=1 Tax=Diatraea saccharalis TaxID=40085 RepID=A0A9N9N3Z5_9NEOP|nr:unnamed protein product [Diatraea saccharalis]